MAIKLAFIRNENSASAPRFLPFLIDFNIISENTIAARVSIVWYPLRKPYLNGVAVPITFGSPSGENTPLNIIIANTTRSIGVRIAPTLSTTLLDFNENKIVIAKNTVKNANLYIWKFSIFCGTIISKAVAPVLGKAKRGPIDKISAILNILLNKGETLVAKLSRSFPATAAAIIAKSGNPAPVNINPTAEAIQLSPLVNPTTGGNIKFPAPNSIANKANPVNITSFFLYIFSS